MKKFLLLLSVLLVSWQAFAQFQQPLTWKVEATDQGGGLYEIRATGRFSSPGWHIYDLEDYGTRGPNGTVMTIEGEDVSVVEQPRITSPVKRAWEELFGMEVGTCEGPLVLVCTVRAGSEGPCDALVTIEWQCCNDGSCLPPEDYSVTLSLQGNAAAAQTSPAGDSGSGKSLWALILEAVAWGFAALLTPCVFPMVPMTVSFFLRSGGEGEDKKRRGKWLATVFGVSIVALYTLPIAIIILVTYITGGASVTADIFNWLATHWLPNLLFFAIFMIFAASFFGAFEIRLPSRLLNGADAKSDRGGIAGAFFMALTLVLVSFSCTGPIVGSVLIKSTSGQFWEPIITMLAFSLAFALPFTVLAFAPSLLSKLPKSGGWLNNVKVTLGFIELALGLKFLSVADQTYHWGLLDREVYLAIWIIVFTLLGLYLLGKIRFEGDTELKHIGVFRLLLVIIDFAFVVYLIPGMWGAPLKAISGYLPPIETQDFVMGRYAPSEGSAGTYEMEGTLPAGMLRMPHGLVAYDNIDDALDVARQSGKKVFVDITGYGCVNCREMEARVWSDPEVLSLLKEHFVIAALYNDDKTKLPESEWVTTPEGKVLKDVGRVNSYIAITRFGVNAQPNYALLGADGELLVPVRGYDLSIEGFKAFLLSAL